MRGVIDDSRLENIAVAIREKTGTENTYFPEEMPNGVNEVYEAGRQAEWSEFWDVFQLKGERTHYFYGFYVGANSNVKSLIWTDKTFKPKYDIKIVGNSTNLFYGCGFTDFKGILEEQGVVFDSSESTNVQALFGECFYLTRLPVVNVSSAPNLHTTFSYCRDLVSVDKLILNESGNQTFNLTFNACESLEHIIVEGVIGQNISFSSSPLSVESLKSVITALKDYTETESEYAYTVTFNADAFAVLEAEGTTAEYEGTACTWAELIDNKKWNLVTV